jgi:uncharacterized protein (TIGR02301 family)
MGRTSLFFVAYLAVVMAAFPLQVRAVEAPFERSLVRLAEILGSLHFLRNLCGEPGEKWRGEMEKLLQAENPDPARRAKFVASFNRGYRPFAGTYTSCTASATEAIRRYMKEGEALTREVAARYGN